MPFDPAISLLGINPKINNSIKKIHGCVCSVSTIHDSKDMELIQMLINDRLEKKMWNIYTIGYYAAIKKIKLMYFQGMDKAVNHYF